MKTLASILLLLFFTACSNSNKVYQVLDTSPYTSIFGKNVLVFDDSMDLEGIKMTLHKLLEQQKYSVFGL
jgi:hypothetical protein